jgi:manganese transport protein
LLTRSFALIPALAVVVWMGEGATADLLVLSQVVLSLQLPFAVIPLMLFCANRQLMGELPTPRWLLRLGWLCAGLIVLINAFLLASGLAS